MERTLLMKMLAASTIIFSPTLDTLKGEGIPEGLFSREWNFLLVRLRDCLAEKGYMPGVVLVGRGGWLEGVIDMLSTWKKDEDQGLWKHCVSFTKVPTGQYAWVVLLDVTTWKLYRKGTDSERRIVIMKVKGWCWNVVSEISIGSYLSLTYEYVA